MNRPNGQTSKSHTQCILQIKTNLKIFSALEKESEKSFGSDIWGFQTLKKIIINGRSIFSPVMNIGYSNTFHIILCKLTILAWCSNWATIMNIRQCLYLSLEKNDGATLESYYIIISNDFNIHCTMHLNKFFRGKF